MALISLERRVSTNRLSPLAILNWLVAIEMASDLRKLTHQSLHVSPLNGPVSSEMSSFQLQSHYSENQYNHSKCLAPKAITRIPLVSEKLLHLDIWDPVST